MADTMILDGGRTRVTVAPDFGGRIAQIAIDAGGWTPLLHEGADIAASDREPLLWGSYAMAPWPNRIRDGAFIFAGRTYNLPITHETHAMHGVGFARAWDVEEVTASSCVLSLALDETAWPFDGRVTQRITAMDESVVQRIEIDAAGEQFPAGAGWHPWFLRRAGGSADVRVTLDADEVYELDAMIPTGAVRGVTEEEDFRGGQMVGGRRLDTCYRNVRGPMRLAWDNFELVLASSGNVSHGVVYTAPHAVCVEPQTCAIDAFNLDAAGVDGTGMEIAEPRAPFAVTTEWRWRAL